MASMSEAKTLLEIKDNDNEYASFLDNVSNLQKDTANVISGYFSKQIKNAYEKVFGSFLKSISVFLINIFL